MGGRFWGQESMVCAVLWDAPFLGVVRNQPILAVVNMVGTRTFTCYMGALRCNNMPCMSWLLDIARFALFAIWSFCALTS